MFKVYDLSSGIIDSAVSATQGTCLRRGVLSSMLLMCGSVGSILFLFLTGCCRPCALRQLWLFKEAPAVLISWSANPCVRLVPTFLYPFPLVKTPISLLLCRSGNI